MKQATFYWGKSLTRLSRLHFSWHIENKNSCTCTFIIMIMIIIMFSQWSVYLKTPIQINSIIKDKVCSFLWIFNLEPAVKGFRDPRSLYSTPSSAEIFTYKSFWAKFALPYQRGSNISAWLLNFRTFFFCNFIMTTCNAGQS